jgi:6,7-dimethyl-8-ribityllumazine synthase
MAEPNRPSASVESVEGARFLIVEARFYDHIATMLLEGAQRVFAKAAAKVDVVSVPGALEIPIAMAIALARSEEANSPYHGAIALGCVIRGETYHFEIVSNESSRALMDLAVAQKFCLGNGILTVENEQQAIVRADPAQGDKGGDAARAALTLHRLKVGSGAR